MKTWFHRLFLALIFTLTFAHVHVGVSVPNGLTSAQISVSVFQTVDAAICTFVADGTTRAWSASSSWTGCTGPPTAADDVVFSTNTVSSTLVIDGTSGSPSLARSIDTTNYTRTITFGASKVLAVGDPAGSGAGSFKLTAGMTFAANSSALIKFVSTTGTTLITTGGYSMDPMTFDGVGGTWQFQDNVAGGSDGNLITLTNGSLDTNGKTIGTSSIGFEFASNNSNTRALTLGASTWHLDNNTNTVQWSISPSTGMTLSAASSTIQINNTTNTSPSFVGGGLTYGTITGTAQTTGNYTIGNLTAGTLTLSQGASPAGRYKFSGNVTVTGTCTGNGSSVLNRDYWTSDTKGTARTISCGTSTFTNADFQDITGAGAATWSLAAITGGSGNCGNVSGITTTAPITAYHKTAVSDNWSAANWYTTSGGSTPISPQQFPLCQDTAMFDANSVTAGSKIITIDASAVRLPAMNWTGVLNTPALAFTTAASYFGSITLVSGMTVSGTGLMTLEGRGSQTITTAALTLTAPITINAPGGTWTQQDALASSNNTNPSFSVTAGTWAAGANNTTLSAASAKFTVNGGTFSTSATLSLTGATAANITVSSGDLNAASGIVSMTGASSTMTLSGGTAEIGTLTRTGFALTIAGTAVQIGTGGAAFATPLTISSGSLAPTTGNKITSVSSTAIAVSANSGGGSCSFGDAGQWRDWNEANDNARLRKAM